MFSFNDAKNLEFTSPKWLIRNVLPNDSTCLVTGDCGELNRLISTYFALHVSSGAKWLDTNVQKGSVVYIGQRCPSRVAIHRRDWMIENKSDRNTAFYMLDAAIDFSCTGIAEQIASDFHYQLAQTGYGSSPSLIVIEFPFTYKDSTANAQSALNFICNLKTITHATIILVDNTGELEGSDSYDLLYNNVDMALSVLDYEVKCVLGFTKMRDHELPLPVIIDNCSAKNTEVSRYEK